MPEKGGLEIDAKNDANFEGGSGSSWIDFGIDFGVGGGVRRGQAPPETSGSGFELLRSENALHPAGCGGYFLMKKLSLGAKGSIERLTLVDF